MCCYKVSFGCDIRRHTVPRCLCLMLIKHVRTNMRFVDPEIGAFGRNNGLKHCIVGRMR